MKEDYLSRSPMERVDEPDKKTEQVPYLREEHFEALLADGDTAQA